MGYYLAGFDVVGVDHVAQPRYPFEFIEADAFEAFALIGSQFDLIHASPPCQAYSPHIKTDGRWSQGKHKGFNEPKLIERLREILADTLYIIENVRGAKNDLIDPIRLCGGMFNLSIARHRFFESNIPIKEPEHLKCKNLTHPAAEKWINIDPIHRNRRIYSVTGKSRQTGSIQVWKELMEMPWAVRDFELAEAVPPAYTRYIGAQIYSRLETSRIKCESCGDWYCAIHAGHIGENCNCWPCDDCGNLRPTEMLIDELCYYCRIESNTGSTV